MWHVSPPLQLFVFQILNSGFWMLNSASSAKRYRVYRFATSLQFTTLHHAST